MDDCEHKELHESGECKKCGFMICSCGKAVKDHDDAEAKACGLQ